MRILALETSGSAGSVAALDNEVLLATVMLDPAQRTARTLAPAMRDVLKQVGWRPADVQLVAVVAGPGSFTGLRLGVTTAKTFAYAVGCEVLGVNTLEVVASQGPPECSPLDVILDAQRQQVFAGTLIREDGRVTWLSTTRILAVEQWIADVKAGTWVSGPALEKLAPRLPPAVRCVDRRYWQPTAEGTGRLAAEHCRAGRRDDVYQLVPQYFRRSAAEEKWEAKGATTGEPRATSP